ncbi:MAG: CBS domain-containing protein [Kiloniellales bacterium]
MQAKDIMTTNVVTVTPDTRVERIAGLLLERRISGVPVVDQDHRVVGIVSEDDLIRRPESGTERRRSWWLDLLAGTEDRAAEYVKTHGLRAEDVMTRNPATVSEDTPVGEIAQMLERRRIKRVPVLRDHKLVGIISRANLLQGLAARKQAGPAPSADDRSIREQVIETLSREEWLTHGSFNVTVTDGVVEIWGWVDSEPERRALKVAIENVPGVRSLVDHLGSVPPYARGA